MAFLDNSGDIILDAVLTDTGRMRLARGDGTFKVQYFALGDDEIDYSLYNSSHASGSAYYDLDIMLSPVLESFTDNRASLKSKLMTINRRDLLYLPVLRLNENLSGRRSNTVQATNPEIPSAAGSFVVTVDANTVDGGYIDHLLPGIINGAAPIQSQTYIRVDQGEIGTGVAGQIEPALMDTAYLIEIDNRLGDIIGANVTDNPSSVITASPSFIDDDNIATYFLSEGDQMSSVQAMSTVSGEEHTPIDGRKGTRLTFSIKPKRGLADSNVLFSKIGYESVLGGSTNFKVIDAVVRASGILTGRRIDIPVKFIKKV